ncbi:MAG: YhfC family intramembrane metalloprotease [Hyphomicrobiaceae bacterium]|nr:MAG: YhfC family intramembrane metalloprotease [Hyphomicrobiaceae bacterium]
MTSDLLALTIPLAVLIMVGMPAALCLCAVRRLEVAWIVVGIGAAAFVASQAVRQPTLYLLTQLFNWGWLPRPGKEWLRALDIAILCVSAGLFEECARYVAFRRFLPEAKSWRHGVAFGLGHGGVESVFVGLLVTLTFLNMSIFRVVDPGSLPGITPQEKADLARQIAAYWKSDWYLPLLAALERLFAIVFHVTASLMVLRSVVGRRIDWLLAAIGLHAGFNAAAVGASLRWGPIAAEAVIGAGALACAIIALRMKHALCAADTPA